MRINDRARRSVHSHPPRALHERRSRARRPFLPAKPPEGRARRRKRLETSPGRYPEEGARRGRVLAARGAIETPREEGTGHLLAGVLGDHALGLRRHLLLDTHAVEGLGEAVAFEIPEAVVHVARTHKFHAVSPILKSLLEGSSSSRKERNSWKGEKLFGRREAPGKLRGKILGMTNTLGRNGNEGSKPPRIAH
jgi:hypothetical protein